MPKSQKPFVQDQELDNMTAHSEKKKIQKRFTRRRPRLNSADTSDLFECKEPLIALPLIKKQASSTSKKSSAKPL